MPTVKDLLATPKTPDPPTRVRVKSNPSHRAWDLPLIAALEGRFSVYVRVNVSLPEMFSVGIIYTPPKGSTTVLLRVNGDHGTHRNPDGSVVTGPHVHKPQENELGLVVAPGMWTDGPPFAVEIQAAPFTVLHAWFKLAAEAGIQSSPEVEQAFKAVHNKVGLAQMELDRS